MVCKLPRKIVIAGLIPVIITGTGDSGYCYLTYNGTKYIGASSFSAHEADKISFTIARPGTSGATSTIEINGTTVAYTTDIAKTYNWIIPTGTKSISINLGYVSLQGYGTITVITT